MGTTVLNLSTIMAVDTILVGDGIRLTNDPVRAAKFADDLTRNHIESLYNDEFGLIPDDAGLVHGALIEFDAAKLRKMVEIIEDDRWDEDWFAKTTIHPVSSVIRSIYADPEDIAWCMKLVGERLHNAEHLLDLLQNPLLALEQA